MTSGMDLFVAFWAVDFDWQPGNRQDYRTRNDRLLKTVSGAGFVYAEPANTPSCVNVLDAFWCDTSIAVVVEI
ncbi:MAG: hypothetical protein ACREXR_11650 [Gammaproteobacteria bacterium]